MDRRIASDTGDFRGLLRRSIETVIARCKSFVASLSVHSYELRVGPLHSFPSFPPFAFIRLPLKPLSTRRGSDMMSVCVGGGGVGTVLTQEDRRAGWSSGGLVVFSGFLSSLLLHLPPLPRFSPLQTFIILFTSVVRFLFLSRLASPGSSPVSRHAPAGACPGVRSVSLPRDFPRDRYLNVAAHRWGPRLSADRGTVLRLDLILRGHDVRRHRQVLGGVLVLPGVVPVALGILPLVHLILLRFLFRGRVQQLPFY